MRLTYFIIGLIFGTMFVASFGFVVEEAARNYDTPDYNDSYFKTFRDKLDDFNTTSKSIQDTVLDFEKDQEPGVLDVIGLYITGGVKALKTTAESFGVFFSIMTDASSHVMGLTAGTGKQIHDGLFTIIIITIFVGIIISALLKKDV